MKRNCVALLLVLAACTPYQAPPPRTTAPATFVVAKPKPPEEIVTTQESLICSSEMGEETLDEAILIFGRAPVFTDADRLRNQQWILTVIRDNGCGFLKTGSKVKVLDPKLDGSHFVIPIGIWDAKSHEWVTAYAGSTPK